MNLDCIYEVDDWANKGRMFTCIGQVKARHSQGLRSWWRSKIWWKLTAGENGEDACGAIGHMEIVILLWDTFKEIENRMLDGD